MSGQDDAARAGENVCRAHTPVGGATVLPVPPPLYYGAAFAGGLLVQRMLPLDVPQHRATALAGATGLAAGLTLCAAGVGEVVRHRTTIVPHHPVAVLVTGGVYRLSRNPMYTGLGFAVAGGALLAGSWWPVIALPGALLAVRRLVIDPEERYLSERFGSRYADYQASVRRWL